MLQTDLWHDTILDAVGAAVQAAGGIKRVAGKLWPTSDAIAASARLRACLSAEHAQKLDPEELKMIGALAREVGDLSLPTFLARAWNCEIKALSPAESQERAITAKRLYHLGELQRLERGE